MREMVGGFSRSILACFCVVSQCTCDCAGDSELYVHQLLCAIKSCFKVCCRIHFSLIPVSCYFQVKIKKQKKKKRKGEMVAAAFLETDL
jgi:hypothetical protein